MTSADSRTDATTRGGPVDRPAPRPVVQHTDLHHGKIWDLVCDTVGLGDTQVVREYIDHPGAVAVIALDDADRVLLLQQYRHPVRSELWEPPAGLRDIPGEPPHVTAARELAEEADLRAATWHRLAEFCTTPGGSNEQIDVYLARDVSEVPEAERYTREEEEADVVPLWAPLDEAVSAVLAGRLRSPSAAVGILAAAAARDRGWATLRPVG